ncbi:MAG: hypothetical protein KC503_19520 [Myxococcales bacterium]|nr:hypothetical protein [Myxococcales bacterium]
MRRASIGTALLAAAVAVAACACSGPTYEVDARPTERLQSLRFSQNDATRVVFWGDSITEGGLYVSEIESALSFGRRNFQISFYNAGSGGNTLQTGLLRLYPEVIDSDPALVVVQFGTNDGRYDRIDPVRAAFFWGWLESAVQHIRKHTTARILIVAPPYFDAQQQQVFRPDSELNAVPEYNETLKRYGAICQAVAVRYSTLFADPNGVMEDYTRERRLDEPYFSLLADGIHPDEHGGVVMALALLGALTEGHSVWSARLPLELLEDGGELAINTPAAVYPFSRCLVPSTALRALERRVLPSISLLGAAPDGAEYTLSLGGRELARFDAAALRAGNVEVDGAALCSAVDRRGLTQAFERRRTQVFEAVRRPLYQVKEIYDYKAREHGYQVAAATARQTYEQLDLALAELRQHEIARRVRLHLERH